MALLSLLLCHRCGASVVPGILMTRTYPKALALLAVGALVIGMIDNIMRRQLVGKDLLLPDYLILISTVGGISLFGMNGFVLGTLIAPLFVSVWSLFAGESISIETELRADRLSSPEQHDG